jgi:hypothetical protein
MQKIIACLGYRLNPDGSINPILQNRLNDSVIESTENPNSILILMGSSMYREKDSAKISEAEAMKKYLEKNFSESLKDVKILTEQNSTSAVEQICFLKENIQDASSLVIISSEFFGDRVKLYVEYIFGTTNGITFIESKLPDTIKEKFKEIEAGKLTKAIEWLKNHTKGDFETILKEQKAFQDKVNEGMFKHPIS